MPPLPSTPSTSEAHDRLAVRSPSSGSLAVPTKLTLSPTLKPEPAAGAVIATLGPAFTVRVIASLPWSRPESTTRAVMTWVPGEREVVENEPPLGPIVPSTSDDQLRLTVRSPSSKSVAVAAKLTLSPTLKAEPSAGAVMVTLGGVLVTSMLTVPTPCSPSASLTEAVIT